MRVLFSVVIAAALALPSTAAPADKSKPAAAKQKADKARRAPGKKASPAEAGRVVSIDPATGELRPAPPSTVPPRVSSRSLARGTITKHKDGSFSAALPEAKEVFTVATVNPDGTVTQSHATGAELKKRGQLKISEQPGGSRTEKGARP